MNKSYLITGANRGIGLALTKIIIKKGERVIALCRKPEDAGELLTISNTQSNLNVFKADVTKEDELIEISKSIDNIDFLICNAGIMGPRGGMNDKSANYENISEVLMTNVAGPFFTIKSFIGKLRESRNPKIAIISSRMGTQLHNGSDAYFYRASKAAVNNIMVSFSNELDQFNIPITSFHPGWVQTDMGGRHASLSPEESASSLFKQFKELSEENTGKFYNYDGSEISF
jgi:NAD(P)-dependent dehydrogenase (short-subunit alcohol dehydrogenase family)